MKVEEKSSAVIPRRKNRFVLEYAPPWRLQLGDSVLLPLHCL